MLAPVRILALLLLATASCSHQPVATPTLSYENQAVEPCTEFDQFRASVPPPDWNCRKYSDESISPRGEMGPFFTVRYCETRCAAGDDCFYELWGTHEGCFRKVGYMIGSMPPKVSRGDRGQPVFRIVSRSKIVEWTVLTQEIRGDRFIETGMKDCL
jgi:hypothetical protein